VPPLPLDRQVGELVDPDERRAGDMLVEVCLSSRVDAVERVGAVDEPVLDQ
jgi:hypothetical protein